MYFNIPRENRKCNCCNQNVIENEYHFLLTCPCYYDLRRKFLPKYYCHWPNRSKLKSLLNTDSKVKQLKLIKFIDESTNERNPTCPEREKLSNLSASIL